MSQSMRYSLHRPSSCYIHSCGIDPRWRFLHSSYSQRTLVLDIRQERDSVSYILRYIRYNLQQLLLPIRQCRHSHRLRSSRRLVHSMYSASCLGRHIRGSVHRMVLRKRCRILRSSSCHRYSIRICPMRRDQHRPHSLHQMVRYTFLAHK